MRSCTAAVGVRVRLAPRRLAGCLAQRAFLSNERPDNLSRSLALVVGDPLQRGCVVYVKRNLHDEAAVARSLNDMRIVGAQLCQLLVEVSG